MNESELDDIISHALYDQLYNELPAKYNLVGVALVLSLMSSPELIRKLEENSFYLYEYVVTGEALFSENGNIPSTDEILEITLETTLDMSSFEEAEDPILQSTEEATLFPLHQMESSLVTTPTDDNVGEVTGGQNYALFLMILIPVALLTAGSAFYRKTTEKRVAEDGKNIEVSRYGFEIIFDVFSHSNSSRLNLCITQATVPDTVTDEMDGSGILMVDSNLSGSTDSNNEEDDSESLMKSMKTKMKSSKSRKASKRAVADSYSSEEGNYERRSRYREETLFSPSMSGSGSYETEEDSFGCIDPRAMKEDIQDEIEVAFDCGFGSNY